MIFCIKTLCFLLVLHRFLTHPSVERKNCCSQIFLLIMCLLLTTFRSIQSATSDISNFGARNETNENQPPIIIWQAAGRLYFSDDLVACKAISRRFTISKLQFQQYSPDIKLRSALINNKPTITVHLIKKFTFI